MPSHDDNTNNIPKRNNVNYSLDNTSSLSSSFFRNTILLFPSALGIEILCILSSITGESVGFYLFGFNPVGIIGAYSLGFAVAGFTIFLIIVGRYSEHKNLYFGCHDNKHQLQIGFKTNFITTFRYFKNGWRNIPILFYNPNRNQLLKKALYLLLTAESICIITAQTIDLLFYNFSIFLSIPLALLAGAFVIALQQSEELKNSSRSNQIKDQRNHTKKIRKTLPSKVVPIALSGNALLIILFVISGGYNHYDDISVNSMNHNHLINSPNVTFYSAPELVVVETEKQGVGIYLDYLNILKPDSNPLNHIFNIPSSRHIINTNTDSKTNFEADIRFNQDQSIFLDFNECHNPGCTSPQEIKVYMVNNNTLDRKITDDISKVKDKIVFINSSKFSFKPYLTQYNIENNHHNIFNKLVIYTQQQKNVEAFYIKNVNITN